MDYDFILKLFSPFQYLLEACGERSHMDQNAETEILCCSDGALRVESRKYKGSIISSRTTVYLFSVL